MSKKEVCIASTLKPLDDVRSYHKIGKTLASKDQFNVSVIGPGPRELDKRESNVEVHPLPIPARVSLSRLFISWKIGYRLYHIKPDVVIFTSHELILPLLLLKLFVRVKTVYDVQENYFKNLWYQNNYPSLIGKLMALWVRMKEKVSAYFIDGFILAEQCYKQELSFTSNNSIVLDNKALPLASLVKDISPTSRNPINILFSGTISTYSGIDLLTVLIQVTAVYSKKLKFHIIGQYHTKDVCEKLSRLNKFDHVTLNVSKTPRPYSEIQEAISKAQYGIICYDLSPINSGKVPTKVYEYMTAGMTIIYQKEASWASIIEAHGEHLGIDFSNIDSNEIIDHLTQQTTKNRSNLKADMLWSVNEKPLLQFIEKVLSK